MKIIFDKEECYCGIQAFYESIATRMGLPKKDEMRFDCTKIHVTKKVQDEIRSYYKEELQWTDQQFASTWCMYGPKADLAYEVFMVDVVAGFIASKVVS